MRKSLFRASGFGAFILLSACGGGGGGGSGPQLVPPPPAVASAFPLNTSASFQPITGNRAYRRPPGGIIVDRHDVAGRSSTVTIDYDAASGTYTLRDGLLSAIFAGSNRIPNGYFDTYTGQNQGVADELKLFSNVRSGASQANAPLQLTYLSYGTWSHNDFASGEKRTTYLLFGYPTGTSAMPRTGSASYQTAVTGNLVAIGFSGAESEIAGSATFSANFGMGAVNTELTLQNMGTYIGTGPISGDQFGGAFTSNDPYFWNGSFAGGFYGPDAKEMGYAFTIKRGSEDPYAGASVAPPLVWIVGTVVGKKD